MSTFKRVCFHIVSGFVSLGVAWLIAEFVLLFVFPTYAEIKIDNKSGEQIELIEVSAYRKNQKIIALADGSNSKPRHTPRASRSVVRKIVKKTSSS